MEETRTGRVRFMDAPVYSNPAVADIRIESAENFIEFRRMCEGETFEGQTIVLTDNIELSLDEFMRRLSYTKIRLKGTFDGLEL